MNEIIQVEDLRKNYGDVKAVDGVSFSIPQGVCFGLLGPNGAGKTTTVEMMEGIIPPDSGMILYKGKPIGNSFRQQVGIQFQNTALPEFITVKETIELFSAFYPNPRPLEEVVDLCSLKDILDRDNRKLSGGQRQRMLLGLAIIPQPQLIFLDEPTTGLDPQARRNFWELIRGVLNDGATVLLTTHYMDEAEVLCDQVAIMDQGQIIALDTPEKLLDQHFSGALVRVPCGQEGCIDPDDLKDAILREGTLEIASENIDATLRKLLKAEVNLDGLSIHKPDLEDLFIKLTGNSLRIGA